MLRPSTPTRKDYKEIIALVNKADKVFLGIYTKKEAKEVGISALTEESLKKGEKNRIYLVLKLTNRVIGFASFRLKNKQTVWISMFYIADSKQGQGYGSVLLKAVEEFALENKAEAVVLETEKRAKWAINFYLKNEYRKLTKKDLQRFPFDKVLEKQPVVNMYIFGKVISRVE